MSDSLDKFNQAIARFPSQTKEAEVDAASERKKAELAKRPAANDMSPIDPYKDEPWKRSDTYDEYVDAGNEGNIESIRYFDDRTTQRIQEKFAASETGRKQREDKAWADDAELGTYTGQAKQLGSGVAFSAARTGSFMAGLPLTLNARSKMSSVSEENQQLYVKNLRNTKQAEAIKRARNNALADNLRGDLSQEELDSRLESFKTAEGKLEPLTDEQQQQLDMPGIELSNDMRGVDLPNNTNRDLMDDAIDSLDSAKNIDEFFNENDFIDGIVNPLDKDALSEDFSETWAKHVDTFTQAGDAYAAGDTSGAILKSAEGIGKVAFDGVGDLWANGDAVFQYLSESSVDLALGVVSKPLMAVSNLGYGVDIYRKALEKYRSEHDGQLPSKSDGSMMLTISMAASAAEHVMDTSFLRGIIGKGTNEAVDTTVDVVERGIAAKVAGGLAKKTANVVGKSVGESATEGFQTAVEDTFSNLETDVDGRAIFEGAAIGMGVGGTIAAAGELRGDPAARRAKRVAKQRAGAEETTAVKDTVKSLVEKGDVDTLLDPEFDGDLAKVGEALIVAATSKKVNAKGRTTSRLGLDRLDERLDTEIKAQEADLVSSSPAEIKALKTRIQNAENYLGRLKESGDTDAATVTETKLDQLRDIEKRLSAKTGQEKSKQRTRIAALKDTRSRIVTTQAYIAAESTQVDDVETLVAQAQDTEAAPEARTEAATQTIVRAMANPDVLDAGTAESMAEDDSLVLSDDQRVYLRSLSGRKQSLESLKSLKEVNQDIYTNSPSADFKSIPQYESSIGRAIETGNTERVNDQLEKLSDFAQSHRAKADMASDVFSRAVPKGPQTQILANTSEDKSARWEVNTGKKLSDKQITENGGMSIHSGSTGLVQAIAQEATYIENAYAELRAASRLGKSVPEASNDPVTEPVAEATPTKSTPNAEPQTQANERTEEVASEAGSARTETAETVQDESGTDVEPASDPVVGDNVTEETPETEQPQAAPVDEQAEAEPVTEERLEQNSKKSVLRNDTQRTTEAVDGYLTYDELNTVNLVQAYFTTTEGLALTANEDYLTNVLDQNITQPSTLGVELSEDVDVEASQIKALNHFLEKAKEWNKAMVGLLRPGSKNFKYRNMLNNFMDANGELEENARTAISAAMYTWTAENGNNLWFNTDDDVIRKIFAMERYEQLGIDHQALAAELGTRDKHIINDIGLRVTQALGQTLNKTAPANHEGQLEGAFGALAVTLMAEQKLIQRIGERSTLFGLELDQNGDLPIQWFVRSNRVKESGKKDAAWVDNNVLTTFTEINRGTQGIVSSLFSIDPVKTGPLDEAPTKVTKTTRRTKQKVPSEQDSALAAAQKQKHFLRTDMLDPITGVLHKMSRNFMDRAAGKPVFDPANTQDQLLASLQGKANAASQDVDSLFSYAAGKTKSMAAPFFFDRSVWRNQRVGLISSLYNPQASKLHRSTFTMEDWAYDVPSDMEGEVGNDFKLSVLEGVGVKVDRTKDAWALEQWDSRINNDEMQAAIKLVQGLVNGAVPLTPAEENLVLDQMPEDMHSFNTLVHLAHQKNAEATGQKTFVSELFREGDGIANGVMLAAAQTGSLNAVMGAMGGFYTTEQGYKSHGEYMDDGNKDVYMSQAASLENKMKLVGVSDTTTNAFNTIVFRLHGDFTAQAAESFKSVLGDVTSKGRNFIKPLLTKLVFGASKNKSIENMGHATVDKVYNELHQLMQDHGNSKELTDTTGQLFSELNAFLGSKSQLNTSPNYATVKAFKFTKEQRIQLVAKFKDLVGPHIEDTLNEQYETYLARRTSFNSAAQMAFHLYDLARNFEKRKIANEAIANGDAPIYEKTGEALQGMLQSQEKELDKRMAEMSPVVHTAMSKGGDKQAGIKMAKRREDLADATQWKFTGKVQFKRGIAMAPGNLNAAMTTKNNKGQVNKEPNVKSTMDYRGSETREVDPGVSPLIMLIHAMDSAIISRVYKAVNMLNVHDAVVRTPAGMKEAMEKMNHETLNALLEWSLPEEIMQTLYRTMDGFDQKLPEMQQDAVFVEEYKAYTKKLKNTPEAAARGYLAVAEQANRDSLEWLSTIAVINQYGYEGGHYTVTDANRVRIAEQQKLTIREKVNRRLGKDIAKTNPDRVAAASRKMQEALERTFREKVESGRVLTKAQKRKLEQARMVNKIFMQTGSLERALGTVYKGTANKRLRDTKRAQIHSKLANQGKQTRDVRKAPLGQVLNMLTVVQESSVLEQGAKDELAEVARLVKMQWQVEQTTEETTSTVDTLTDAVNMTTEDSKRRKQLMDHLGVMYNGRQVTPWGVLGTPVADSDPVLMKALRAKPEMTVAELLPVLRQALKSRKMTDNDRTIAQVLGVVSSRLESDVTVQLVEQDTPISLAPEMGNAAGVRGVTVLGETKRVFLKGPDFVESNVTVELVAHELLHVLLANSIEAERSAQATNPKHRSDITAMIKELDTLRVKAKELVNNDPTLKSQFGEAVSNTDELISWGLTNEAFQRDVLGKIEMGSRTQRNKLITGMQAFIDTITKFIFRGTQQPGNKQQKNGITVLVNNASGLINAAKGKQTKVYDQALAQGTPDPMDVVMNYTTTEIYQGLGGLDSDALRGAMETVVDKLHGPYGSTKARLEKNAGISADDVYLNAVTTGVDPFSSKTAATLKLTDKEAFVLEQVEASLREVLDPTTSAYKDLVRVFQKTRKQLTFEDFLTGDLAQATSTEITEAKAQYDFIFKLEQSSGESRTDHLSRFAAMAMAYPALADKMNFDATADNRPESDKLGDSLKSWYRKATQQFSDTVNRTAPGQRADARMERLIKSLVDIESRKRRVLARKKVSLLDEIEDATTTAGNNTVRGQVTKLARTDFVRDNDNPYVRLAGRTARLVADDNVGLALDAWEDYRAAAYGRRLGLVASMVDEVRGPKEGTQFMHDLLNETGKLEQGRKQRITSSKRQVLDLLGAMTKEESESVTKSVLKTDLSSLIETERLTYEEVTNLMGNPSAQGALRKKLEAELKQAGKHATYYQNAAQATGYFMAKGHTTEGLVLNTHNMVRKVGMPDAHTVPQATMDQAQPILEALTTLYALQHTNIKMQESTKALMERNDGEGVRFVLGNHSELKKQALDKLFQGSPALMQKGYIKEIYDPHSEVVSATAKEGAQLTKAGYSKGKLLAKDPAAVDQQDRWLYVLKEGGVGKYVSGVMSLAGKRPKGTTIHSGVSVVTDEGIVEGRKGMTRKVTANKQKGLRNLEKSGFNDDLGMVDKDGSLVAVVNPKGEIVNYRYLMTEKNKDDLLKRDTRIEDVMGAMEGSIYDKAASEDHNIGVVTALKQQFDGEYSERPGIYIEFSPQSEDAQIREQYALLPEATKRAILKVWGRNGMSVRNDLLDLTFGYRKLSIADTFDFAEDAKRNVLEALVFHMGRAVLGDKAASKLRSAEDVWQSVIKELKDIYVIKNLWTMVYNVMSNVTLLLWHGVPVKDLIRNHKVAFDGLMSYQADSDQLMKLTRLKEAGNRTDLDQEILELEHALERNPVKVLIDAGQFQTIMEDIDAEDDTFSYKSRLVEWTDNKTAKVPGVVKTIAKTAYMAHDTPLYKVMFRSTQMSDFIGRYTLYEHLINKPSKPKSSEDAMRMIKAAFINYDIPTHRTLQYLNDTGAVLFTKYYLRIQRVLMELYQDRPLRAIMMAVTGAFLANMVTVQDSGFFGRIGDNPFETGALAFPGALDETLVMQAALSPFNQ